MLEGTNLQSFSNERLAFLSRMSKAPWTIEKILPFLFPSCTSSVISAAILCRFLEPVSVVESAIMQLPAQNSLQGRGLDLFSQTVLRRPGKREVLPVWNSLVLALEMVISLLQSSFKIWVVSSALEHRAKFSTSLNWACAISCLKKSVNLFTLNLEPIVAEGGKIGVILLQPQQMAMSSNMSHSCKMSPLQKGASTLQTPYETRVAQSPVLAKYLMICSDSSLAPIKVYAFLWRTVNSLEEMSGVKNFSQPLMISTGQTSKGVLQYSAKDQMILFKQTQALGLLSAVTSTKTFLVLIVILECSPLMMGGTEQTTSLLSNTKGQTGLSLIKCRYSFSLWFSSNSIMPKPFTFFSWFKGMNQNYLGSLATYLKGPFMESRS